MGTTEILIIIHLFVSLLSLGCNYFYGSYINEYYEKCGYKVKKSKKSLNPIIKRIRPFLALVPGVNLISILFISHLNDYVRECLNSDIKDGSVEKINDAPVLTTKEVMSEVEILSKKVSQSEYSVDDKIKYILIELEKSYAEKLEDNRDLVEDITYPIDETSVNLLDYGDVDTRINYLTYELYLAYCEKMESSGVSQEENDEQMPPRNQNLLKLLELTYKSTE